jgi:hypothetical protein
MEVKTANGTYEIKKPAGGIGTTSIIIIAGISPKNPEFDEKGQPLLSTADEQRIMNGFKQWSTEILPFVAEKTPFDDQIPEKYNEVDKLTKDELEELRKLKFELIPGEDQWIIFQKVVGEANNAAASKKFR